MAADLHLALMAFPQEWDGTGLALNLLCIPSVDPLADPIAGAAPPFADRVPNLRAVAIPSLDTLPSGTDAQAVRIPVTIVQPASPVPPRPAFTALAQQAAAQGVTIGAPPPIPAVTVGQIRKALPDSYLALTGQSPTGELTTTTDEYCCALREQKLSPVTAPPKRQTSWGELISYALRQPVLATALGLRYELSFPLDHTAFADGGWVFVELADDDAWAQAAMSGNVRLYAARMPPLESVARPVFAAVLFAVDATGTPGEDEAIAEAETYDAGFAQLVHVNQPTANDGVLGDPSELPAAVDVGIQVGWDDEQVVTWHNRQLVLLQARRDDTLEGETPLGVLGYRVDVADITGRDPSSLGAISWESLLHVHGVLPKAFGSFDGELMVEPAPLRLDENVGEAWLPHYFANWRGGSLAVADDVPSRLLGKPAKPSPNTPVLPSALLAYGHSYAFRVRLGDLSGGGPLVADAPTDPGPAGVATLVFRRHVPPKSVRVDRKLPAGANADSPEPESLTVFRPTIGYPEVLYTELGATAADRKTIVDHYVTHASTIQPGSGDVAGLPDPDVERVRITVSVRAPAHDIAGPGGELDGGDRVVYQTERELPALPPGPTPSDAGLEIELAYVDAPSILEWAPGGWPSSGPLVVPRARDVQLLFEPLVRDDPDYFGVTAAASLTTSVAVRAESRTEPALLVQDVQHDQPVRAFFFRRPPDTPAPPVVAQLAQALDLVDDGLSLTAPPGRRVVFGASRAIRNALSGDAGTITFAAESTLLGGWLVAVVVDIDRDWTWDGLDAPVALERDGETVGSVVVPRVVGPEAVSDPANWDRARTRLVFFDAIDPHEPTPSGFPEALGHEWTLSASTASETGAAVGVAGAPTYVAGHVAEPPQAEFDGATLELTLPIVVPPQQISKLASVGLALSPYVAGNGYASTEERRRALWLELAEPIANAEGDALFARVVGHGADPLLYAAEPSAEAADEPSLVLDPELMRTVIAGDSDDRAGIGAMTRLEVATDDDHRFLLPLPPGIEADDPELFGFWTYELRVGHAGDPHAPHQRWWSTAQGRFGRPLRVNGVQHPAPTLHCRAGRASIAIAPTPSAVSPALLPALESLIRAEQRIAARLEPELTPAVAVLRPPEPTTPVIEATAGYATPELNGRPLVTPFTQPKTTLCFFLYAQVVQADGSTNRNVLLAHRYGVFTPPWQSRKSRIPTTMQRDRIGRAVFTVSEVQELLFLLGLSPDSPLSMLAVELLPGGVGEDLPPRFMTFEPVVPERDPLGAELGVDGRPQRILRVSPLVPIAPAC